MEVATLLRVMLSLDLIAIAVVGLFYLRRRVLPWQGYVFWGMVIVFLPLIGPFVVLLVRPGQKRSLVDTKYALAGFKKPQKIQRSQ